jgi:capsular exopolysaccharide synthesis family protein
MSQTYKLLQPRNELQKVSNNIRLLPAGRYTPPPRNDDSDVDTVAAIRILLRRRRWIYACTATMVALAALACLLTTPRYTAVSQLQLLKQNMGGIAVGDANSASAAGYTDALDFTLTLQTQAAALKSDTLAMQVIKELNLADTPEFRYTPPLFKNADARQQMSLPFDESPLKRAAALRRFQANLKVDAVSGTRLITVSYTHPDPAMAARIVNQLLSDFVEHNFQVRYIATNKATEFLRRQLVDLKSEVEKSQERAVQLEKDSGIFGQDEHHNIVITRLEQLNNDVTAAESARVMKQAVYNLARSGNPELVAGLVGGSASGTSPDTANSLQLLNNLRQQESEVNAQIADASSKYGPAYPRLIEMNERAKAIHASIQKEVRRLADRAKSEYEVAASREAAAKKAFAEQKATAANMNNKAIDFTIAKHEADSSRELYDNLSRKLKEAGVLAGLRSSELNVVDPAAVPARPSKPRVPLYLAFGVLSGLALGVGCAFVTDAADRTVRDPDEVEAVTRVPVLGIIPQAELVAGNRKALPKANTQKRVRDALQEARARLVGPSNSLVAEAFRTVRTSLLLSAPGGPAKVVMITSSLPQEGKSFSALNLASVLAQTGGRVLLVDADLRRGSLSRFIRRCTGTGLSHVLRGSPDAAAYRQIEEIPGLIFMPAGACPESPSELLGSQRMADLINVWRQQFDYVVIDTSPVIPVTDAVVLSPYVDGVIMVVRFAVTNRQSMMRTIRVLQNANAQCLGVLVNAMDVHSADYYHYSGAYGYGGYAYEASDKPPVVIPPAASLSSEGERA